MLKSLLYVSRSRMTLAESSSQVEDIVRLAQVANQALGVTGALISTEADFAQLIEGSEAAVDKLMAKILVDPRHEDVRVVKISEIQERRFDGWWMAYSGPSIFVNRHIKPLLTGHINESDRGPRAERLIKLMQEFTSRPVTS